MDLSQSDFNTQNNPLSVEPPKKKTWLIILAVVLGILILSGAAYGAYYWWQNHGGGKTACTQETKQCPDGSYVGRTGPDCEFAECPLATANSLSPTPNVNGNFNIAYIFDDGVYVAKSDGTLPKKVFDCLPFRGEKIDMSKTTCFAIYWLKDGRLLVSIANGKTIFLGQDYEDDSDLIIIDSKNNSSKTIKRPSDYYMWGADVYVWDPLIVSKKEDMGNDITGYAKYNWFDPDTGGISEIFKKEINKDKHYFYLLADTSIFDSLYKSNHVPNQKGDILLVSGNQVILYNVLDKTEKVIFDDGQTIKIEFNGVGYDLLGQNVCKLSSNSSFAACFLTELSPHKDSVVIAVINIKTNDKTIISYQYDGQLGGYPWSFQFSPDGQYLYIDSGNTSGSVGNTNIYRFNLTSQSLTKVLNSVRVTGDAEWMFALSPELK